MRITCNAYAYDFPPSVLANKRHLVQFTSNDIAHALFTTGRASGDQVLYGLSSVYEFLHRVAIIPAYLRVTPDGSLAKSQLAIDLDRSEKVGLSYALGQAITAIFSSKKLGVSHLLHTDRYASHHGVTFRLSTNQRPDLFGLGREGWVVAEAKGRSNTMEYSLRAKLKSQKQMIRTIDGSAPWVSIGCVASFPQLPAGQLRIDAVDPSERSDDSIDLPVSLDRFMQAYYAPFWLRSN